MYFENKTIIITDPCYIINEHEDKRPKFETWPGLENVTISTKFSDFNSEEIKSYKEYENAVKEFELKYDDWDKCEYGEDMEVLGIHNYICRDTIYGDWSCTTYNKDTHDVIGHFCADAGLVAVFDLDEVLKYNPNFDWHITKPWTTTIIKDFTGEVNFEVSDDDEVSVVGTGNINFYTNQTGL